MRYILALLSLILSLASDELSLAVTENDPSSLVEGVSVITGDLYVFEEDYVVQGANPISVQRSFLSREGFFRDYQHLTGTFLCTANRFAVNEPNGTTIYYSPDPNNGVFPTIGDHFFGKKRGEHKVLRYNALAENDKGLSNTKTGEISAHTNLKNQYLLFDPSKDEKGKSFTLYTSDGTKREYVNLNRQEKVKTPYGEEYLVYDYKLVAETLPCGRIIHYDWTPKNQIEQIYTTNLNQNKTFSRLKIPAKNSSLEVTLQGSDQRHITYKSRPTEVTGTFVMETIDAPDLPQQCFNWDMKPRSFGKMAYLEHFSLPKQRTVQVGYSDVDEKASSQSRKEEKLREIRQKIETLKPKAKKNPSKYQMELSLLQAEEKRVSKHGVKGKGLHDGYLVKTLSAPVGSDASPIVTHSFFYNQPNKNSYVLDVKNNKTAYFWNDDYRLTRVNRFIGTEHLHSADIFLWEKSNLRCKSFLDSHSRPIFSRAYSYDDRGNAIEESFYGNLSGKSAPLIIASHGLPEENGVEKHAKKAWYSQDGRNLLIKQEDPSTGLVVLYSYRNDWHLLESKSICDLNGVKILHTYEYDDDLILTRETEEDRVSKVVKKITPYPDGPYVGLPQVIEESDGDANLLRKTVLHYGKGAAIEQKDIYDAKGNFRYSLKMNYDEKGRLLSETNAAGLQAIYGYDEVGNRIYAKDFSGRLESFYKYDFSNRLIEKEEKGNDGVHRVYRYRYDTKHNLISETDPYENQTIYIPDAFGHRKEIRLPSLTNEKGELVESVFIYEYDSAGNEIEKRDPEGNVTYTTYNAYGMPTHITRPDGNAEEFTYYLNANLKTHTDPTGVITSYVYDYLGRVLKKTVSTSEETFEYTGHYLTLKTDSEKNKTIYRYDRAGRKIGEECCGEATTYTYDELGRLHKTQKGDLITVIEYDLLDQIIEERSEAVSKELLRKVRYEYDLAGNRKTIIRFVNGKEEREEFKYDSINRLIEKKNALGFIETYEYDPKVNRKTHTDSMGLQTIETYTPQGQIASTEKKKGKTVSFERKYYNRNGKLSLQIDTGFASDGSQRDARTRWEYNSKNLLKTLTEADETIDSKVTQYTYTPRSELETVVKPDGKILTYRYNDLGHLESIRSSDGTVNDLMKYNSLGHLQESGLLSRKTDPFGRILSETFPQGYTLQNTYDNQGRRKTCAIPQADCLIAYEYNPAQLKRVVRKKIDETVLYSHDYTSHDLSGNLLQQELILNSGPVHFSIDPLSRQTAIASSHFSQKVLEFDSVGNIKKMRIGTDEMDYIYDDLYQLTSESGPFAHTYAFDSLNNRLQKDEASFSINPLNQLNQFLYDKNGNPIRWGEITYSYDALDRLTKIQAKDFTLDFTYDCLHRCLSQTTRKGNTQKTSYFLYDGQNEIGAFDENQQLVELRVLGNTPHAEIGAAIAIELKGEVHIPIHDLQGNLAILMGSETTAYRYSAFGEEKILGKTLSPWRFSSKRADPDTQLVYFGRRCYIPFLGRWLTPDPVGFINGMNLYAYVHNAPLTHFDEYGLIMTGRDYKTTQQIISTPWETDRPLGAASYYGRYLASRAMHDLYNYSLAPLRKDRLFSYDSTEQTIWNERRAIDQFFGTNIAPRDQIRTQLRELIGMQSTDAYLPTPANFLTTASRVSGSTLKMFQNHGALNSIIGHSPSTIKGELLFGRQSGESNKIWTSTKRHNSVENAFKHWKDHGHEFSTLQNSKQYVEATRNFVNNSPPGTLMKIRANGDILFYNPYSNTFAIINKDQIPRTMYKPNTNKHPYPTNMDYFNAQQ